MLIKSSPVVLASGGCDGGSLLLEGYVVVMDSGDAEEAQQNGWPSSGMDPAAYYTYMATVMQHMATAGAEGAEGGTYAMDTGEETAVAAFAAADGGGVGGWAAAAVPGMEDAYRAQLEQHYCQYYQNYYSMMLTAKMAEVETWYTAAVAQEELEAMEEEKEKPENDTEQDTTTESEAASNVASTGAEQGAGDVTQCDILTTQSTTVSEPQTMASEDVTTTSGTVSDTAEAQQSMDGEGGSQVDANACSTMEEYYEKLNEYYRAYYEKFYADWFAKELKQHRRNVALERQRELDKRREERARQLGLGEGKAITPEEFAAQQALFNKKNSRFQKEDSAGHWASKGLADDRDGRMMSIYFDAQSYQEEMNALKEKREKRGLEFRAIKKKKHSTKHWKRLKEEKKRQKAAEWLLKD